MKTILQKTALFAAAICLSSCATQPLGTPSGKPEVTIKSSLSRTQSVAITTMAAGGFPLTNQTANTLTFEQDLPPDQAALFLMGMGNSYHSQPKSITRFVFVPSGGLVRVFGTVQAATQGPFGQTKTLDLTGGKGGRQLQAVLEVVKQRAEQR